MAHLVNKDRLVSARQKKDEEEETLSLNFPFAFGIPFAHLNLIETRVQKNYLAAMKTNRKGIPFSPTHR